MIYLPEEDSYLLQKQLKKYAKGKSVLDMGTGSGILAIEALSSGASSVTAVDINEKALDLLRKNYPEILSINSNLFSKLPKKAKFDLIVFNPPYLPFDKREPEDSRLATTGGKSGDETILKFLKQSAKFLNKNGIILVVLSSLTPKRRIKSLVSRMGFSFRALSSKNLFMEFLEVWEIKHNNS